LNNNKQLNSINVVLKIKLIYMQTNCLRNFNKHFLSIVIVAIVVVAFAFAFAFAFIFVSIVFALIFIFLALILAFFAFFVSLLFVVILFALFAFFDLLFSRNIEHIYKLKKIETKLIIYNNCLILLLRICF